jgi:ferric enterobactin receptor
MKTKNCFSSVGLLISTLVFLPAGSANNIPMKTKFTLYILSFAIGKLVSQSEIKGRIIDSISTQPIQYVVTSVYKSGDTKPLNGKLSDSTGTFLLGNLSADVYDLKIEFIGYQTKTLKNISVKNNQPFTIGEIILSPSALLGEVTVTAQQDAFSTKIDKQVFKADQFQTAKGGTAIDVLKNMPAVTVNADEEIRLRGNTGFLLLVNGKPVVSDLKTFLHQIPANSIENIEILTAPSAKYDADGKSGIINITTKKGSDDGLAYTINLQYGLPSVNSFNNTAEPERYGSDVLLNYKKKQWEISVGGGYQQNDLAGRREGDVYTIIDNRYSSFPSLGERSFQRRNYSARAMVTFTPGMQNVFTVSGYHGQRRQFRRADIYYNNRKTDIFTGANLGSIYYFNSNLQKKQGNFSLASAEYAHTFKNKSVLSVSGLYEYAVLDGFTKNLNTDPAEHFDTLSYVLNTAQSPLSGIRVKADYTIIIGKSKLESGYQFRYQEQTGSFIYRNAVLGTPDYQLVPEFSANIHVLNHIQGIYSQYSGSLRNLQYVAGLRYEYATRIFDADKQSQPNELILSNFFPSANLVYSLKNNLRLKAGYSKRVQRSNSNELNPYPEREHSETFEQGDPHILPEFVDLTELGLIKELKKGSYFITFYNQQVRNVVNRVNSAYNDTIINRIYTNAGNAQLWGIETGFNLNVIKWWNFYIGANVYNYQIRGNLFNNEVAVKNDGTAYSISTNQNFSFGKNWSTQFNLNYLSLRPTAIGEDSRFISPNIAVKKTLLKGALSISLLWQNISLGTIKSNEQRITTRGANFYTTTNYIQEKDVFLVNLSYQLKQISKKSKLHSSEFGEKEF